MPTIPPKWLDIISDNQVTVNTNSLCMTLCDLTNDKYYKLIVVELPSNSKVSKAKLKVYKGTGILSEQSLPGVPSAMVSCFIEEAEPKIPLIALSVGPSLLFYRNLKPYFKYTLPSLPIQDMEVDIWRKLPIQTLKQQVGLMEGLKSLGEANLSWKSQQLLELPQGEREEFIKIHAETELQRLPLIASITTVQKCAADQNPTSCLVIATEDGDLFILDTKNFEILFKAKIRTTAINASFLSASGVFDVDFWIMAACRTGSLCILRKSWNVGREIINSEEPIIAATLLPIDQTIMIVDAENTFMCYSKKGKKMWSVTLPLPSLCMIPIQLSHLGITLVAITMEGGLVQMFSQKFLVDEFKAHETVTAMIFGHLGQEEHVLTLVTKSGALLVKILKRTAEFKTIVSSLVPAITPKEELKPFKAPFNRSYFFNTANAKLENMSGNAYVKCNNFQIELRKLRLTAARATVDAVNSAESTISAYLRHAPIKLAAEVYGTGPQFRLFLTIENMSPNKEATNLRVILHANHLHYTLMKPVADLPPLLPGIPVKIDFEIIAVIADSCDDTPETFSLPENSNIQIFIVKIGEAKPLIAAIVDIPDSVIEKQA